MVLHIKFGRVQNGKYKGLKKMRILGNPADKTSRLSLKNPHVRRCPDNDIVENRNDGLCAIELVERFIEIAFPPGYEGPLFV